MASVLVVAHAPLATALRAVAHHVYPEKDGLIAALDIAPERSLEAAEADVRAAVANLPPGDVLLLSDVFGATPCKAAQAVAADNPRVRLVAGVNVPMLWRALCYADCALDELIERAVGGAQSGVLPVASARRQNQPTRPLADDQDHHHDQQ